MEKYLKFCGSLFLMILLLIPFQKTYSQISADMVKYWYYRNRMNNYYIVPGEMHGESQIICIRNLMGEASDYENPTNLDYGQHGKYTGLYLCVLATEYYLLNKNGRTLDALNTQDELFKALFAAKIYFDVSAEQYFTTKSYCQPNSNYNVNDPYNGFL